MIMKHIEDLTYDLCVVGGGMSGTIAAITAARNGVRVALVQDRPVLGGNASSEIKMHITGADHHASRPNARETGIIEEILLENKKRNPANSFEVFDLILWEKAHFQQNLDLYLNAQMTDVTMSDSLIESVIVDQTTTGRRYRISAQRFVDASGDGTLGYLAGAEYRKGRESQAEFNERLAPLAADDYVMGSSIQFTTKDMGHPVPFVKPTWAYTYTEEQLTGRDHSDIKAGYWWIEVGGSGGLDTITNAEDIRDELLKVALGVWDHIKNQGDHGAANRALDWIGFLPGKRESRRFIGDYTLTANDILENHRFDDAVAYGGWPMDVHTVGGIQAGNDDPTVYHTFKDVYQIPYRCLYSRNISNLFIAGRLISTTHMAFGSTRVMATCSVIGQAIGIAAAKSIATGLTPRETGRQHIHEIQQEELKEDLYIPHISNQDPDDHAREAYVSSSSSSSPAATAVNVVDGVSRTVDGIPHYWESETSDDGEWIRFDFKEPALIRRINIRFDSNLCQEIMPSLHEGRMNLQDVDVQHTLVKDFDISLHHNGAAIARIPVTGNYLRNYWADFGKAHKCDSLQINLHSTNGDNRFRIFEIRCYS